MNKYINDNKWIQLLKRELNLNIEKLIKQQFSIFIWYFDFYWKLFAFHYVVFFINFVFFIQTFLFFIRVDRNESSAVVLWNEKKNVKLWRKIKMFLIQSRISMIRRSNLNLNLIILFFVMSSIRIAFEKFTKISTNVLFFCVFFMSVRSMTIISSILFQI